MTVIGRQSAGYIPAMAKDRPQIQNDEQYEALRDKGMSKERAARIANSPDASKHGGESHRGGSHAQKVAAGRKGGQASARKHESS